MSESLDSERKILENAANTLLESAKKAGADAAEVCGSYSEQTRITLEKQDFHLASSDQAYQLGLRVQKHGKAGFVSANSTTQEDLKLLAKQAVQIADFSPENPFQHIAKQGAGVTEGASFFGVSDLFRLPLQKQKEWSHELMRTAIADKRFRLNEGSVGVSSSLFLVFNTEGVRCVEEEHQAGWSLMGMGVEGENITSFDYFSEMARDSKTLEKKLGPTTKTFCNDVLSGLQTGQARSYKGIVFFSPRSVIDIFLSGLSSHLNGRAVVENTGRWSLADIGKALLSTQISVRDIPHAKDRSGACRFDREGVATTDRSFFEKGILQSFFLDGYASKALKLPSTGNAVGGASGIPSAGVHTLVMEGGLQSLADLRKEVFNAQKECLWVHRFSGQVDSVTGDFSGVAKGAEWWNAGEKAYVVKETLISGNIFEVLGKNLIGLSREKEVVHSSWEAPSLAAQEVSVTTK